MNASYAYVLCLFACLFATPLLAQSDLLYKSPTLEVERLSPGAYLHRTYLSTQDFGKVACNGVIFADGPAAVVFDTPPDTATARELLDVLQEKLHLVVTAVVPTHFHADCLGGLPEFHRRGIASYGTHSTIDLAISHEASVPQHGFDSLLVLPVGAISVDVRFPGAGHTADNVVAYFPTDRVLFGGCLIKALGAKRGNLDDADLAAWPASVARVVEMYPAVEIVVPGHGAAGDGSLLEYTQRLFARN